MKKIALAAVALIALGVGTTQAADLPRAPVAKAPVMAPLPTWQGIYWGLHGGWGWGDVGRTIGTADIALGAFPPAGAASSDLDGGIFGGHVGFNWQAGPNWLFGLEGSLAWSGLDGTAQSPVAPGVFFINTDLEWLATFTPRLGWTSANWLFYVKGGLAAGRVDSTTTAGPGVTANNESSLVGWTVGVGMEWMWSPNWIFGIEYNYYDLGSASIGGTYTPLVSIVNQSFDVKFSSVLARLSYKW